MIFMNEQFLFDYFENSWFVLKLWWKDADDTYEGVWHGPWVKGDTKWLNRGLDERATFSWLVFMEP